MAKNANTVKVQNKGGKGNPNHQPAGAPQGKGGQFASTDGGVGSSSSPSPKTKKTKKQGRDTFRKKYALRPDLDIAALAAQINDLNRASSVPILKNGTEIYNNLDSFFSQKIVSHLDRYYGKSVGVNSWQFCPDKKNPYFRVSLFTCILGKYRFPENCANVIDENTYQQMLQNRKDYLPIYRGVSSDVTEMIRNYASVDIDNLGIYGNGYHGTNVYTTSSRSTASAYAGHGIIKGFLDVSNANIIQENDLKIIQRDIVNNSNLLDAMKKKSAELIAKQGYDSERADQIAQGFVDTIKHDQSLVCILLGYDYSDAHYDQSQYNVVNLKKWYIVN